MEPLGLHFYKSIAITGDAYGVPTTAAALSFVDNGLSNDTITRTAGSFVADGFVAGQSIVIGGTRLNDQRCELLVVNALSLEVAPGTLADEASVAGASVAGAAALWTFAALGIELTNRGSDDLFYSFDGTSDDGRLPAGETRQLRHCIATDLWLRRDGGAGSNDVEITVWG